MLEVPWISKTVCTQRAKLRKLIMRAENFLNVYLKLSLYSHSICAEKPTATGGTIREFDLNGYELSSNISVAEGYLPYPELYTSLNDNQFPRPHH